MENQEFFVNFDGEFLSFKAKVKHLIPETIEEINARLSSLDVKVIENAYSEKKISAVNFEKYDPSEEITKDVLVIKDTQGLPLFVDVEKIGNITREGNLTIIIWRGGGSNCVPLEYFEILKKYFLVKTNKWLYACYYPSETEKHNNVSIELNKNEIFLKNFSELKNLRKEKLDAVRIQQYEEAEKLKTQEDNCLAILQEILIKTNTKFALEF